MRMFNMLRAMDAFTTHDRGGVEEVTQAANEPHGASCTCDACMDRDERLFTVWHEDDDAPTTCHKCGAVVEDDALAVQTNAAGESRLAPGEGVWYCHACLVAGLRRIQALLAQLDDGDDGEMGEDGE